MEHLLDLPLESLKKETNELLFKLALKKIYSKTLNVFCLNNN